MDNLLETRQIAQLPQAVAVPPGARVAVQVPDAPAFQLPVAALFGQFLSVTVSYETSADLSLDLDHPADSIALVYGDRDPAKSGYWVKSGGSGAGLWISTTIGRGARGYTGADAIEISGLMGVPAFSEDLGVFDGDVVPANVSVKQALAALIGSVSDRTKIADLASAAAGKGAALVKYSVGGVGAIVRTLLDLILERPVSIKDFGAKCDGATDDTAATQAWVNHLATNGLVGSLPKGNIKLTSTITVPQANFWGWKGRGKYKSAFFYAGADLGADIFSLGGTGSDSRCCIFSGFSVFSFVEMTGGHAFKLTNFTGETIDDVSFGGELYAPNTYHGIWFNGTHEAKLTRFDIMGQGDGIIVNAGTLGNSSNSDLYLDVGFANNCGGAGIRCAGGFGGLNIGQVQVLGNAAGNLVVDNSISAASNREIILSSNFVADGVLLTQDNVILNSPSSSAANLICAGTIGSAGRHGINVVAWPDARGCCRPIGGVRSRKQCFRQAIAGTCRRNQPHHS